MSVIRAVGLVAIGIIWNTSAASAADMAQGGWTSDALIPQEVGTGWYLRGDIGASLKQAPAMSNAVGTFGAGSSSNQFNWGIGIGYQFSPALRVDATIDSFGRSRLAGTGTCALWSTADCTGVGNVGKTTTELSTLQGHVLLANAYYELGNWSGLAPYVGAGLGAARVDLSHVSTTFGSASPDRSFGKGSTYSLAAAVHAGTSYTLGEGMVVDLGYRFLWINGGQTADGAPAGVGRVTAGAFTEHQLRAGLRYFLN